MSSFLNLFRKKNKSEDRPEEEPAPEQKERKLKKQLSISRSGRYKQKKQRGAIADRTDLFQQDSQDNEQNMAAPGVGSGHSRSPNNSCREINGVIMPGGMRRNEQIAS